MPIGLVMYDADRRLIIANARYQELYHLPDQLVRAGTAMDEILKHRIGVGEYSRIGSRGVDRMDPRRRRTGRERETAVREMNDGRIISIIIQPLKGGGWVSTHEDVTERTRAQRRSSDLARRRRSSGGA